MIDWLLRKINLFRMSEAREIAREVAAEMLATARYRIVNLALYTELSSPISFIATHSLVLYPGQRGYIYIETPGYVYDWWTRDGTGRVRCVTPMMTQGTYLKAGTLLRVTLQERV